ncbi:MAG TPA: hypothetical protein VI299_15340, partial [Polyangiales bacterium]
MTSFRTDRPLARPSSPALGSIPPAAPAQSTAPPLPPQVTDARARVRQLRAEAEASNDRTVKATLLFEAGY